MILRISQYCGFRVVWLKKMMPCDPDNSTVILKKLSFSGENMSLFIIRIPIFFFELRTKSMYFFNFHSFDTVF